MFLKDDGKSLNISFYMSDKERKKERKKEREKEKKNEWIDFFLIIYKKKEIIN